MKKKGFTLVELLAVIVILAIIAVIATPIILGVIETAKKGAAENSAKGYLNAVEKQIAINMLDESKTNIVDGVYDTGELNGATYGVSVKGQVPTSSSWVQIVNKQIVGYSLKIGEYVVNYNETDKKIETTKNGEVAAKPSVGGEESSPNPPVEEEIVPTYYAFGTPTTESTTYYTTLGKNVFATLYSDRTTAGVCINDGNLFCLKPNDYDNSVVALKAHFGEDNCDGGEDIFGCTYGDFYCNVINSSGQVSCATNLNCNNGVMAQDSCNASSNGGGLCGIVEGICGV